MKLLSKETLYNIFLYILICVLIVLISFDIYKYLAMNINKKQPKNSVYVSPLTGERIQEVNTSNFLLEVEYSRNELKQLTKIEEADIVYETYLRTTNNLIYKGIFYNKKVPPHHSIEVIKTLDISSLPKLQFMDVLEMNKYNFKDNCDTIFIEYSKTVSSSFTFNGESYEHYTDSTIDKNPITNKPFTFSNIIVEYITSDKNNLSTSEADWDGYLFSQGKAQKIYRINDQFYLEDKKTPLTITKGNTFWIRTDKFTEVITSKCLVYNR